MFLKKSIFDFLDFYAAYRGSLKANSTFKIFQKFSKTFEKCIKRINFDSWNSFGTKTEYFEFVYSPICNI